MNEQKEKPGEGPAYRKRVKVLRTASLYHTEPQKERVILMEEVINTDCIKNFKPARFIERLIELKLDQEGVKDVKVKARKISPDEKIAHREA